MGGRGTFAAGNKVDFTYKTVGYIEGVKVLEGIGKKHNLPEEAHSSKAYIKLYPDGNFQMMRIYDNDHYLVKEIAYHREPKLDPSGELILHIHHYNRNDFNNRKPRLLTTTEYEQYKKYFNFKKELKWIPTKKEEK